MGQECFEDYVMIADHFGDDQKSADQVLCLDL